MKLMGSVVYIILLISTNNYVNGFWWNTHTAGLVEKPDYISPTYNENDAYIVETFDDPLEFNREWIESEGVKTVEKDGLTVPSKYNGNWGLVSAKIALPDDTGLILKSEAKHAAISCKLRRPFTFSGRPFIVQYDVIFQDGQKCGGAYLKLLTAEKASLALNKFNDKTPYSIMFGPDKCGTNVKLHFIFRHRNPINGSFEEKHCKQPTVRIEDNFEDKKPHLYRLIVKPDNTFRIFVDRRLVNSGSLLKDFTPPVNPPSEIDDPNDKKPHDWDDREKIPDLSAEKPDDWDEDAPETIDDPYAVKPEGWLDDEPLDIPDPFAEKPDDWNEDDGEWQAPLVPNPACEEAPGCGKWKPPIIANPNYKGKWEKPLIDNPDYQGKWSPRRINNPEFFEDNNPYKMAPIGAVGFELWAITPNMLFDNVIITDKLEIADDFASKTFDLKIQLLEGYNESLFTKFVKFTNSFPWLWAVYVVIILILITVLAVWCCFPVTKDKKNSDILDQSGDSDDLLYQAGELLAEEINQDLPFERNDEDDAASSIPESEIEKLNLSPLSDFSPEDYDNLSAEVAQEFALDAEQRIDGIEDQKICDKLLEPGYTDLDHEGGNFLTEENDLTLGRDEDDAGSSILESSLEKFNVSSFSDCTNPDDYENIPTEVGQEYQFNADEWIQECEPDEAILNTAFIESKKMD